MDPKKQIREKYKGLRGRLDRDETAERSERICAGIVSSPFYREAGCIFFYYPLGNEADVRMAAVCAWKDKKLTGFPRVCGDDMDFYLAESFDVFKEGTFGVMEPWTGCPLMVPLGAQDASLQSGMNDKKGGPLCPHLTAGRQKEDGPAGGIFAGAETVSGKIFVPSEDILVLVPGLAFDRSGNRMGYGKGYYDKYFAGYPGCTLMGIAYDFQVDRKIPAESHDLKMDVIMTDSACGDEGLYWTTGRR